MLAPTTFDRSTAVQDPRPMPPVLFMKTTPVFTPRGVAIVAVIRLEQTLAELTSADRAYCLSLLRDLVETA